MRLLIVLVLCATSIASAQDLMGQAREAADAGRLVEARDLLVQLMDSDPSPEAAANLAMVRRGLGELTEAQSLLERLVGGELGELDAERQARATELLRQVRSEVATITVIVHGASTTTAIRLDGRLVGETNAEHRLTIACNPGRHMVRAISEGQNREREVEVAIGGVASVELRFDPPTPEEVATDPVNEEIVEPVEPPGPNGIAIGVGVGVAVAVAVAVAVVLAVTLGGDLPKQPDGYLGVSRL